MDEFEERLYKRRFRKESQPSSHLSGLLFGKPVPCIQPSQSLPSWPWTPAKGWSVMRVSSQGLKQSEVGRELKIVLFSLCTLL
jgi:hypothetical protein